MIGWFAFLAATVFVPETTAGGGTQVHLASDLVLQAFFGMSPMLDAATPAASATPVAAIASIALKLALVAALLAAAGAIARRRSFKRG